MSFPTRALAMRGLGGPWRWIGPVLILPLLLLAVSLPQGVMPAQAQGGQIVMVLCSGDGPMQMLYDPQTGDLRELPPAKKLSGCDWAATQPGFALAPAFAVPLLLALVRPAEHGLQIPRFRPVFAPLGQRARGPPALI
jgi:hypothetical protein